MILVINTYLDIIFHNYTDHFPWIILSKLSHFSTPQQRTIIIAKSEHCVH